MRLCIVPDCGTKHFANGYCRKHDTRVKRNGQVESLYDKDGYADLGGVRDTGKGRRGSLAVNIINDIKYKALQRGKTWNLTHPQAFELITSACTYCGHQPTWPENRVGIDRKDSARGYEADNCLPCCKTCNFAKNDMSYDEFIAYLDRMTQFRTTQKAA